MSAFSYRARDAHGLLILGQAEAGSREEVEEKLSSQGLIPIQVTKKRLVAMEWPQWRDWFWKVRLEDLIVLTRQFTTLVKVGMGMQEIFGILVSQTQNKKLQATLSQVRTDIESGTSLSTALSKHPKVFSDVYVNMVLAGEEAGLLDKVLADLSQLLAKENEIKSGVKSALLYPKIVMMALIGAVIVLTLFVTPKFAAFYATYKAELPFVTQLLIYFSQFITHYWFVTLLLCGCGYFILDRYKRSWRGRIFFDRLELKLPVFGPLHQKIAQARFGHIFAALYRSGLPVTKSLEIVAGTIDNRLFSQEVLNFKSEIAIGKTLSQAMRRAVYFPTIFVEMTAVGEKAGALDEMMEALASHYDSEIAYTIKNLTTLLEPILLLFIFGAVAFLALATFLPIWNLSQAVLPH
ncbi:MAG: type II secretion system F family protein [Deltaproteobacteria bacterium]|nr:type II secretion system F family protein [Deltaproteobacteria bacterium]